MACFEDDLDKMLVRYSEFEHALPSKPVEQLDTIRRYHETIQANNCTSIFDQEYDMASPSGIDSAQEDAPNMDLMLNDNNVTRVYSGRGRGGRNYFEKPGGPSNLSDNDILRQLRKAIPLGYGNEITENAIRAHQQARQMQRRLTKQDTLAISSSRNSSPSIQSISPQSKSRSLHTTPIKALDFENLNNSEINSSRENLVSSPAAESCDLSPYFSAQDEISLDSFEKCDSEVDKQDEAAALSKNEVANSIEDKKVPLPMSEILRRNREDVKKRKTDYQNDVASREKIYEILLQDRQEMNSRKKGTSTTSNMNNAGEPLSWRNREGGNVLPRHKWSLVKKKEIPNTKSILEFPPLRK